MLWQLKTDFIYPALYKFILLINSTSFVDYKRRETNFSVYYKRMCGKERKLEVDGTLIYRKEMACEKFCSFQF